MIEWRDYIGLAYTWADRFYFPGADREDVRQIALLGLWRASLTFNGEGRFPSWAQLVVRRDLIDALNSTLADKHRPLTESARAGTTEDGDVLAYLPGGRDPVDILIAREEFRDLVARFKRLSAMEREALIRVVFYGEAYTSRYTKNKSRDQALQRARRKLAA